MLFCWHIPEPAHRLNIGTRGSGGQKDIHLMVFGPVSNVLSEIVGNNVYPPDIMQLSGHKNIESLNHYNIASKDQQRKMSNILTNAPATTDATDFTISPSFRSTKSVHNSTTINSAVLSVQHPFSMNEGLYSSANSNSWSFLRRKIFVKFVDRPSKACIKRWLYWIPFPWCNHQEQYDKYQHHSAASAIFSNRQAAMFVS